MAVVYLHKKRIDDVIFYVGVGELASRAYSKSNRNRHWKNIAAKYEYYVEITHTGICIEEAKCIETYLVCFYGRKDLGLGELCNMTDGGDGCYNMSEEQREKLRKPKSESAKKKMSESAKKKIFTESHWQGFHSKKGKPKSEKWKESRRGKPVSEATKEKLRVANLGKKMSKESIEKRVKSFRGYKHTEETKKKIGLAVTGVKNGFYGKKHTEETRLKMRKPKRKK